MSQITEKIINSHTHFSAPNAIINYDILGRRNNPNQNGGKYCSIGLHPWDADYITTEKIRPLFQQFKPNCKLVAIGECGIDRACKTDLKKQTDVFVSQLDFAAEKKLPVIIHCVKAWSDIIPIINNYRSLSFILHDYRANNHQTVKLLEYQTYFSFGKSVLNPTEKLKHSLALIPHDRILIETDNDYIHIDTVLESICLVLQINKELFTPQLIQNTQKVFNL